MGIGVTPSASHYETLEIGTVGSGITGRGAADTHFLSGLYWDGASTRKYAVSGVAVGTYQITNGAHYWSSPAAGTAGNTATVSANMTLDASGKLLVGLSSDPGYYATKLIASAGNENGITIAATNTSATNYLMFADGTSGNERYRGYIGYSHNADDLYLASGGNVCLTVDGATSNVGIGTNNPQSILHVQSNSTLTNAEADLGVYHRFLNSNANINTGSAISLGSNSNPGATIYAQRIGSNNEHKMGFQTRNSSGSGTTRMTILGNGNVGIDDTDPDRKLVVKGGAVAELGKFHVIDDNNSNATGNPLHINYSTLQLINPYSGASPSANGTKVAKLALNTVTTSGYAAAASIMCVAGGTGYNSGVLAFNTGSNNQLSLIHI